MAQPKERRFFIPPDILFTGTFKKSLIPSLNQAYIFGDVLYYPIEKYFGNNLYNIFLTKLYKYYINEIPYFDEYFRDTELYDNKKYNLPDKYYKMDNYISEITDEYYD